FGRQGAPPCRSFLFRNGIFLGNRGESPRMLLHASLNQLDFFHRSEDRIALSNRPSCPEHTTSTESETEDTSSQPTSTRSSSPSRIRRKRQTARARRRKRDERQDWRTPHGLRAGHETLLRLILAQGKQNFLALSGGSQRGISDELPIA